MSSQTGTAMFHMTGFPLPLPGYVIIVPNNIGNKMSGYIKLAVLRTGRDRHVARELSRNLENFTTVQRQLALRVASNRIGDLQSGPVSFFNSFACSFKRKLPIRR